MSKPKELLWNGTMRLRFVYRTVPVPSNAYGGRMTSRQEKILQQQFYCDATCQHEWRDIPLEVES